MQAPLREHCDYHDARCTTTQAQCGLLSVLEQTTLNVDLCAQTSSTMKHYSMVWTSKTRTGTTGGSFGGCQSFWTLIMGYGEEAGQRNQKVKLMQRLDGEERLWPLPCPSGWAAVLLGIHCVQCRSCMQGSSITTSLTTTLTRRSTWSHLYRTWPLSLWLARHIPSLFLLCYKLVQGPCQPASVRAARLSFHTGSNVDDLTPLFWNDHESARHCLLGLKKYAFLALSIYKQVNSLLQHSTVFMLWLTLFLHIQFISLFSLGVTKTYVHDLVEKTTKCKPLSFVLHANY